MNGGELKSIVLKFPVLISSFIETLPICSEYLSINKYLEFWSTTIKVESNGYKNAYKVWNKNHPELLKQYYPYFKRFSAADFIINKINSRNFRRDYPFLEDKMEETIWLAGFKAWDRNGNFEEIDKKGNNKCTE